MILSQPFIPLMPHSFYMSLSINRLILPYINLSVLIIKELGVVVLWCCLKVVITSIPMSPNLGLLIVYLL